MPSGLQRVERVGRRRLDRIGDGDHAGEPCRRWRRRSRWRRRWRRRSASPSSAAVAMPSSARNVRVAERDAPALDHADDALAGRRIEAAHRRERDACARLAAATMAAASGCSLAALDAGGEPQHLVLVEAWRRHDRDDLRLAFGQRAGLVDDERVDLLHALERLGILDQHAGLRAAADADHDRHRRGEAERAGAGDDQHAHGGDQRVGEARLRPEHRPGGEGERPRPRSPPARTSPRPDRRAAGSARASAAPRDHLHDLRQQRVAADLVGAHHEAAGLVERAADDLARRRPWSTGIDSPVTIDSSSAERPSITLAVDRHLLARPHAQPVADRDRVERHVLVAAVVARRGARSSARDRAARGSRRRSAARARSSSTWPSSTSTVITAAASK